MPILRHGEIVDDIWLNLADDETPPEGGAITVSHSRWQTERQTLKARKQPLGLRISGDVDVHTLANDFVHFDLVAVAFPGIADGRGYSQARLIRQRYGFTGELRATGPLVRDVFAALERVGFDAIDARDEVEAKAWTEAVARITVRLQPDLSTAKSTTSVRSAAA
jgi:uncharacterized protein (DUF934 family)